MKGDEAAGGEGIEFVRKTYENGKMTIPKEIRDLHGIRDGDYVRVVIVGVVGVARPEPPPTALPVPAPSAATRAPDAPPVGLRASPDAEKTVRGAT